MNKYEFKAINLIAETFEKRGVKLTALFDNNPDVIGRTISGYTVKSMEELDAYTRCSTPAPPSS